MRVLLVAVILMYSVHESHESYASRYEIRRYLYAAHEYKRLHGLVTELLKGKAQTRKTSCTVELIMYFDI